MHHHRRIVRAVLVSSACGLFALFGCGRPAPDNTSANAPDRAAGAVTADQQKENAADRDLTQKIRQALMDDTSLSTYAHNVKVVSQEGQVTLKGPVRSEQEKQSVETKAQAIAGSARVINEMTVAPPSN